MRLSKFSDPIFPRMSALVVRPGHDVSIKSIHKIETDNLIRRAMDGEAPSFIVADPHMLRHMAEARGQLAHLGLDPIQQARAVFDPAKPLKALLSAGREDWMSRVNAGVTGAQARGMATRELAAIGQVIGALKGLRGTPEASSPSEVYKLAGHMPSLWTTGVADLFARARHNAERLKDADAATPGWRGSLLEDVIARAERRAADLDRVMVNLRPVGSRHITADLPEGCPARVAPALMTMDPRIVAALMMQFGKPTDPEFWTEACIQGRETLNGFRVPMLVSYAGRTDQRNAVKRLSPPWTPTASRARLKPMGDPLTGQAGALLFNLRRVVDARDVERFIMSETREGRLALSQTTPDVWRATHRERLMDGWFKLKPDLMTTLDAAGSTAWPLWFDRLKAAGLEVERPSP